MFFEQYSHEPYVAVARFICGWTPLESPRRAELPRLRERAHAALGVMERHLATRDWFTGARYGIADIALFAYTDVAGHGGVSLAPYPALRAWLARVRATPGFVALPDLEPDVRARVDAST
jgi:glutathione S-transferase